MNLICKKCMCVLHIKKTQIPIIHCLCLIFYLAFPLASLYAKQGMSKILLAQLCTSGLNVTQYLVNEKFVGVKVLVLDGKKLSYETGQRQSSACLVCNEYPKSPLDGEF